MSIWLFVLFAAAIIFSVITEYLLLTFCFKFQKEKRFLYTLLANLASIIVGALFYLSLLHSYQPIDRISVWLIILSIYVEYIIWFIIIGSKDFRWLSVLLYLIIGNILSSIMIFVVTIGMRIIQVILIPPSPNIYVD